MRGVDWKIVFCSKSIDDGNAGDPRHTRVAATLLRACKWIRTSTCTPTSHRQTPQVVVSLCRQCNGAVLVP